MKTVLLSLSFLLAFASCGTPAGPTTCEPRTCPFGCCDSAGVCQPGSSDAQCGSQAKACTACSAGLSCQIGRCMGLSSDAGTGGGGGGGGASGGGGGATGGGGGAGGGGGGGGTCDTSSCSTCCSAGVCVSALSNTACGSGGQVCTDCAARNGVCASATSSCVAADGGTTVGNALVRLVEGDGLSSGRLEAFIDGGWGGVCDDVFGDSDNGPNVVCRSLGFTRGTQGDATSPTSDFAMDEVSCTGAETSLQQCTYIDASAEDCGASEAVLVSCF